MRKLFYLYLSLFFLFILSSCGSIKLGKLKSQQEVLTLKSTLKEPVEVSKDYRYVEPKVYLLKENKKEIFIPILKEEGKLKGYYIQKNEVSIDTFEYKDLIERKSTVSTKYRFIDRRIMCSSFENSYVNFIDIGDKPFIYLQHKTPKRCKDKDNLIAFKNVKIYMLYNLENTAFWINQFIDELKEEDRIELVYSLAINGNLSVNDERYAKLLSKKLLQFFSKDKISSDEKSIIKKLIALYSKYGNGEALNINNGKLIKEIFLKYYKATEDSQFYKDIIISISNLENVNFNIRISDTLTPFIAIIKKNDLDLVEHLINKVDINYAPKKKITPFITSLYLTDESIALELIKNPKLKLNSKDNFILFLAVKNNHYYVTKALLDKGFNVNAVDKETGKTLLIVAIENGNLRIVKLLIDKGANVNYHAQNYEHPLILALKKYPYIAKELLKVKNIKVNVKDKDGNTPLIIAAAKGYTELVKALLDKNANPNLINKKGEFPLMVSYMLNLSMTFSTIYSYIKTKTQILPSTGYMLVKLLIDKKDVKLLEKLLNDFKVDLNKKLKNGETLLTYTLKKYPLEKEDTFKIFSILLNKGNINPNLTNGKNETPIIIVLNKVNNRDYAYKYIDILIKSKANVNKGYPLDIAIKKYGIESDISLLLIKNGAIISKSSEISVVSKFIKLKGFNPSSIPDLELFIQQNPDMLQIVKEYANKIFEDWEYLIKNHKLEYIKLKDNSKINKKIFLPVKTRALIFILGEKHIETIKDFYENDKANWVDYGYIVNINDNTKYPSSKWGFPAGGAPKNFFIYENTTLIPSLYEINVFTDDSHSFGSGFNADKPDLVPDKYWGMIITFPSIARDSKGILQKLMKNKDSIFKENYEKLLKTVEKEIEKEIIYENDAKNINPDLSILNKKVKREKMLEFIKNNENNPYFPMMLTTNAYQGILIQQSLTMSKLVSSEGRLLPPSEDLADKLYRLFGLPPTDYGNDEVVVRGSQVEYRGKEIFISGIIENNSNKTLNLNILGLFQFLTIRKTSFLFFSSTSERSYLRYGIFKVKNIKPKERRAFVFKITSGKGSGINIGGVASSHSRTFLKYYDAFAYLPYYFELTKKEEENQISMLKTVGLYNKDLSKIRLSEIQSVVKSNLISSYDSSNANSYSILNKENAYVKVVRLGGGNQVDIVPSEVCKETFIATTSSGNQNTDFRKDADFYISNFPTIITVRYKGGCGLVFDNKKDIFVKVKIKKPGAYKIYINP